MFSYYTLTALSAFIHNNLSLNSSSFSFLYFMLDYIQRYNITDMNIKITITLTNIYVQDKLIGGLSC